MGKGALYMTTAVYGDCACVCCREWVWLIRIDGYAKQFTHEQLTPRKAAAEKTPRTRLALLEAASKRVRE